MPSNQITFMGIDPSIQEGFIAYAVVDHRLNPMAVGVDDLDSVVGIVEERRPGMIGVGAPPRLNQGIVSDAQKRAEWGIPPRRGRPMDCRVGEYELLQQGIEIYRTPSQVEKTKAWMQTGFRLYERLEAIGFQAFSGSPDGQRFIETPSETCYWIWLGQKPMAADTFGGRLQRQLILYELGMEVLDPILLLEEITRHRLLQGSLLEEGLYTPAGLQALAAGYIAWGVVRRPEEIAFVGDVEEGQVAVPNKFEQS
jgi:hypothetical protein